MKLRIFIIGLLSLCGMTATASASAPPPGPTCENYFRPGTVWTVRQSVDDPEHNDFIVYYTILDEITFEGEKVLPFAEYRDADIEGYESEPVVKRYLRVDGDKVYWRSIQPSDHPEWYLLYDFGLKVGEETTVFYLHVTNDPENKDRKIEEAVPVPLVCIRYDYYLNDNPMYGPLMRVKIPDVLPAMEERCQGDWIIGMGHRSGSGDILESGMWGWDGGGSTTLCVESPKGNVVYGDPTAGIKNVSDSDSSKPAVKGVYNVQGIRIADTADNLPAGLYIVDGKKICIR